MMAPCSFLIHSSLTMPKKPIVNIRSFGIYDHWDSESKVLPKIQEFTTQVNAVVDIEFGLIVNIQHAKNQVIEYCIYHPGILDEQGNEREPFDGQVYAKTNDWDFYLGDTIWEPISDKLGDWRMTVSIGGRVVAEKTFEVS